MSVFVRRNEVFRGMKMPMAIEAFLCFGFAGCVCYVCSTVCWSRVPAVCGWRVCMFICNILWRKEQTTATTPIQKRGVVRRPSC